MDNAPNQRIINPIVFVRELITKADDSGCLLDASEQARLYDKHTKHVIGMLLGLES